MPMPPTSRDPWATSRPAGTPRWPPTTTSRPRSRSSAARTSASPACSTRCSARTGRSSRRSPGTTRDAIDTHHRVGPERDRPDRHRRHPQARQGGVRAGRRALLDAAGAQGDLPGGRRGPRHRRRRRADGPGRPRRRLRRGGGHAASSSRSTSGTSSRTRPTGRFDEYVDHDPPRGAVPRLRAGRVDQRQDRPARRARAGAGRGHLGRAPQAHRRTGELNRLICGHRGAQPARRRQGQARQDLLRDPGRRRAADLRVLRHGRRRRSTSATGATSRTGSARRSASTGRPIRLVFREQVREKRPKGRSSRTRRG